MSDDIVQEQIAYYRARAQEYDESIFQTGRFAPDEQALPYQDAFQPIHEDLLKMGPFQDVIELACGTGVWTADLARIGQDVTALDASPEMLEINRQKLNQPNVRYAQADLFAWKPEHRYDAVFTAFWLSHVPPEHLDAFLSVVQQAIAPGGRLIIVDQWAPLEGDLLAEEEGIIHRRPLSDGRTFRIFKIFYDLDTLRQKLAALSFSTDITMYGQHFFMLTGTNQSC